MLAKEYGVNSGTISRINKKRRLIKESISNKFIVGNKRKTLRNGQYIDLEKRLYTFFLNQRKRNAPVSGLILKDKAL